MLHTYLGAVFEEVNGKRGSTASSTGSTVQPAAAPTERPETLLAFAPRWLGLVHQSSHRVTDGRGEPELCGAGASHVDLQAPVFAQQNHSRS